MIEDEWQMLALLELLQAWLAPAISLAQFCSLSLLQQYFGAICICKRGLEDTICVSYLYMPIDCMRLWISCVIFTLY